MGVTSPNATLQLSPMQQGMLLHNVIAPQSGAFVLQTVFGFHGALRPEVMSAAWDLVLERHAVLRSAFRYEGVEEPVQEVWQGVKLPVETEDWRHYTRVEQDYRLESYLRVDRRRGFEISAAPLMRLGIFRVSDSEWQVVWTSHNALLDGRSRLLVLREVFVAYDALVAGKEPPLPGTRSFDTYLEWLQQRDLASAESYWRDQLRGFHAATPMVVSRAPGEMLPSEGNFGEQQVQLSEGVTSALRSLAQRHGLTLHTMVKGAWALLLSRYSGEEDVVFGDARARARSQIDGGDSIIGLFLNAVPVRVRVEPGR